MAKNSGLQMADNLKQFLSEQNNKKFATEQGAKQHAKMQRVTIDPDAEKGDPELIARIKSKPELIPLFSSASRAEAPIAGYINGKFISRRIDRMMVNNDEKSVIFLDYKTDIDKKLFREKYIVQMNEYATLLRSIYPGYSVHGFILWLQDFTIDQIS